MNAAVKTQPRSMISLLVAALVTLACVTLSGRSEAQPTDALTRTVSFGDLNLHSEQGAQMLYRRLRSAAREVCSPFEAKELSRRAVWQSCIDSALASAVLKVNSPLVSAVHNQRVGRGDAG